MAAFGGCRAARFMIQYNMVLRIRRCQHGKNCNSGGFRERHFARADRRNGHPRAAAEDHLRRQSLFRRRGHRAAGGLRAVSGGDPQDLHAKFRRSDGTGGSAARRGIHAPAGGVHLVGPVGNVSEHLHGAQERAGIVCRAIDTKNISIGAGALALYAARLAKEGVPFEELCRKVEQNVGAFARVLLYGHAGLPARRRPDRARDGRAGLAAEHQADHLLQPAGRLLHRRHDPRPQARASRG